MVAWHWPCRWTWSTSSTASSGTEYAEPSSFPLGCRCACYVDDTLVLVWGTAWGRTVRLAELAVACMTAIKELGLKLSREKSEAMWFCRRADHGTSPRRLSPEIGGG